MSEYKNIRADTLKMLDWLLNNPNASNIEFGTVFNCHPNNATNLRSRYPKIFSGEIPLGLLQDAIEFEQTNKQTDENKQTIELPNIFTKNRMPTRFYSGIAAIMGIPKYSNMKREQLIRAITDFMEED